MLPDRFWEKVDVNLSGCWTWTRAKTEAGYGRCWWQGKDWLAHRASYTALIGPIPEGLELDHLCRNRACVRPDHLEPVAHAENVRRADYSKKIARQRSQTHCLRDHPLSGENLRVAPDGRRHCRACHREKMRRYRCAS